jgi:hypothetical protein
MIAMSGDKYVSPYLLRPLRSYEEALRDRQRRSPRAGVPGETARERSTGAGSTDVGNQTTGTGSERT